MTECGRGHKRILIVYNPAAGRSRRDRFAKVVAALENLGCTVRIRQTTRRGDAEAFARAADPDMFDVVAAAGGDGTVGEIVNGLRGRNLPLGIIPLGTANVLAAEIGLPPCPRDIAAVIAAGSRLCCYAGLANGRQFTMMAGVGFDAHVVNNTSLGLKRLIGKGAYVWAAIRELIRPVPGRYRVTLQGRNYDAASVIIGKGHFYAGRYVCTPDARLDRARFQVCLFSGGSRRSILRFFLGLLRGKAAGLADVTLVETDYLRIDGNPGDPVQGDGDIITRLPLEVGIADQPFDLLVPPQRRQSRPAASS